MPRGRNGTAPAVRLHDALAYLDHGWSIIPIRPGTKQAACSWTRYQAKPPTESQVRRWFGGDDQSALAVILGDVSGGLVCRDFDDLEAFMRWATANPNLAERLPTVETGRPGRHVYATGEIDQIRLTSTSGGSILPFDDGELRGGGYCLLPPSVHPDGPAYRWLAPLPDELPTIDLHEAGFIPCNREDRENGADREDLRGPREHRTLVGRPPNSADDAIDMAIAGALPIRGGQRHRMLFDLARGLKAIPGLADAPLTALKPYVRRWHCTAVTVIKTKAFEESWLDFCESWSKVKSPKGQEPIRMLLTQAVESDLPDVAREYEQAGVKLLVALCRELQRASGAAPFFLACRTAGELLGVDHATAWRWLRLLQHDEILEVVSVGDHKRRQASRYRYLAPL